MNKFQNSKKVYWQLRPLSIHGGVTTMQPTWTWLDALMWTLDAKVQWTLTIHLSTNATQSQNQQALLANPMNYPSTRWWCMPLSPCLLWQQLTLIWKSDVLANGVNF
jgi:NADH dehydrogenase/NADH:ubiquinone oxidoreductase subunit G